MLCRTFDTLSAAQNEPGKSFEHSIRGELMHIAPQRFGAKKIQWNESKGQLLPTTAHAEPGQ